MKTLFAVVFLKTVFVLGVILYGSIGLGPDEAQYWTWSQALDIGYYSKPPGIAWLIFLGTKLFGNSELGVRFFSLMIGAALPFAVYALSKTVNLSQRACVMSGVIMALTPLGFLASLLATTDGPMVLFWTLGLLTLIQNRPLFLGVCIALGATFKWPIYLLWVFALPLLRWNRSFVLGIFISLIGMAPSLIWNLNHDFATFKHVSNAVQESVSRGNPLEFFFAQFALFSPILFGLLLFAFFSMPPGKSRILGQLSALILGCYLALSFFKKIQGNWCVFAYPSAIVFLSDWADQNLSRMRAAQAGVIFSAVLTMALLTIPLPYRISPFRHNVGWQNLNEALEKSGYDAKDHFLFADKYQMTSLLSFYGPTQKPAYFFNLQQSRKNQFSFWEQMEEKQVGKTGYFATLSKDKEPLERYFSQVRYQGCYPLTKDKEIYLYECSGFNGLLPKVSAGW